MTTEILPSVVKQLPDYVFGIPFRKHFFFEDGILADPRHFRIIQQILKDVFPGNNSFLLHTLSDRSSKAEVPDDSDWFGEVRKAIASSADGIDTGVLISGTNGKWVILQRSSMDLGVFALRDASMPDQHAAEVALNFFTVEIAEDMVRERDGRFFNAERIYGTGFLEQLVVIYSAVERADPTP
jgi:hypothetical protein